MEGPASDPGINVRALQDLFSIAAEEGGSETRWLVSVSMMEIYQEAVHDLLRCGHVRRQYTTCSGSQWRVECMQMRDTGLSELISLPQLYILLFPQAPF